MNNFREGTSAQNPMVSEILADFAKNGCITMEILAEVSSRKLFIRKFYIYYVTNM